MPFDGVVLKSVICELQQYIIDGRVRKIYQPETDEILINIASKAGIYDLVLSCNSVNPRLHITTNKKINPNVPPGFCMLLRKHLIHSKVVDILFHDFERVATILFECEDELGYACDKKLTIEIMGKHSNIILHQREKIIDCIKHVDSHMSSIREVMPARTYTFPPSQDKLSPRKVNVDTLIDGFIHYNQTSKSKILSLQNFILSNIRGFSPLLCREICHIAKIDPTTEFSSISIESMGRIKEALTSVLNNISSNKFQPCIIFSNDFINIPIDFHCMKIEQFDNVKYISSINETLNIFYREKDISERLSQRKSHLYKIIKNNILRCNNKIAIYNEKLSEAQNGETLKLYGELILANIYSIKEDSESVSLLNYYSPRNEYINISLDKNCTPQQNAQKYFKLYTKAKHAFQSSIEQLEETSSELEYLESILITLEYCLSAQEIDEVKQELMEQGYLNEKKKTSYNQVSPKLSITHYKSSDGIDIYVGKNNRQNDYLTLKLASHKDIWLHAKEIPGSHVIIKSSLESIPQTTLLEAAQLAAYYSKSRFSSRVQVDYTCVKNVKKPHGFMPGKVIYDHYKTLVVTPIDKFLLL